MPKASSFIERMIPPVLIIVITVILSLGAYKNILNMEEEKCRGILENTADTINHEIEGRFGDNITILKLAANAMVQENRVDSYDAIRAHINAFQPMTIFDRIDVYYPDNTALMQSGERVKLDGERSFETLAAKGEFMSQRMADLKTGEEVIAYSVPVTVQGEIRALMVGVVSCKTMPALFQTRAYDGEAVSCLIDSRDGSFLMDDWHDSLGNLYDMKPRQQLKGYENVDLVEDVRNGKTDVTAYKSAKNGQNSYMYYMPVGMFDWRLLIVVQEQVAFGSLLKLKGTMYTLGMIEAVLLLIYFISTFCTVNQLEKNQREIEEKRRAFERLSYNDTLTMLYNRNKYNQVVEDYQARQPKNMGVAFLDLNGLKQVNDEQGHKVGDMLIQDTARLINTVFPEQTFRIGGDEFVVLAPQLEQSAFQNKMKALRQALQENQIHISAGDAWKSTCGDLTELLREADENMYQEKRRYYESAGNLTGHGIRYV